MLSQLLNAINTERLISKIAKIKLTNTEFQSQVGQIWLKLQFLI